ncbi:MAG TPA: VCBS repeat-containing protein, partial [Kofleriaceae bacterium]
MAARLVEHRLMRIAGLLLLISAGCGKPHSGGDAGLIDSPPSDGDPDGTLLDGNADGSVDSMPPGTLTPEPADPVASLPCATRLGFPGRPVITLADALNSAVGDFTGDGKPDLVINAYATIQVAIGMGDGTYSPPTAVVVPNMNTALTLGDVNGDAKLDLLFGGTAQSVSVMLNNGSGGFSAAQSYNVMVPSPQFEVVDVNGDGRKDLVSLGGQGLTLSVLLNSASGFTTTPALFAASSYGSARYFALGDVSGDGRPDVVVHNQDSSIDLLLNDGSGGFLVRTTFAAVSAMYGERIAVRDLNSDGRQDVIAAIGSNLSGFMSVRLNQGNNMLSSPVSYGTGSPWGARALDLGDVNGDGHVDVVAGSQGEYSDVEILLGTGS